MRMRNISRTRRPSVPARAAAAVLDISPVRALSGLVGLLAVAYMALMAFTMTYAVIHTQYAEQARDAEAQVGTLETQYFNAISQIDHTDPVSLGYVQPTSPQFAVVPNAPTVAVAQ